MINTIKRFETLLCDGLEYLSYSSEPEISTKPSNDKWSKKEILGHLVDSGINNLQRFTEIQFSSKPYKVRDYKQDELVRANNYQRAQLQEIIDFWTTINKRILILLKQQTDLTLGYSIELSSGKIVDLRFLIQDYVAHLEHHLAQIKKT